MANYRIKNDLVVDGSASVGAAPVAETDVIRKKELDELNKKVNGIDTKTALLDEYAYYEEVDTDFQTVMGEDYSSSEGSWGRYLGGEVFSEYYPWKKVVPFAKLQSYNITPHDSSVPTKFFDYPVSAGLKNQLEQILEECKVSDAWTEATLNFETRTIHKHSNICHEVSIPPAEEFSHYINDEGELVITFYKTCFEFDWDNYGDNPTIDVHYIDPDYSADAPYFIGSSYSQDYGEIYIDLRFNSDYAALSENEITALKQRIASDWLFNISYSEKTESIIPMDTSVKDTSIHLWKEEWISFVDRDPNNPSSWDYGDCIRLYTLFNVSDIDPSRVKITYTVPKLIGTSDLSKELTTKLNDMQTKISTNAGSITKLSYSHTKDIRTLTTQIDNIRHFGYFTSLEAAKAAAESAVSLESLGTELGYYFGQTITVVEDETARLYIIQPDKTLAKLKVDTDLVINDFDETGNKPELVMQLDTTWIDY